MCRLSLGEVCMCVTMCVCKRAVYICSCIFHLFLPGVVLCTNQSEWTRREGAGFPGEVPAGSGLTLFLLVVCGQEALHQMHRTTQYFNS